MPEHYIVTVAMTKGGVGKSTLAFEVAAHLDAVLIDFDWDAGNVSRGFWGVGERSDQRLRDALISGRAPRPRRGAGRPRLVPGHPDLGLSDVDQDAVADYLTTWAIEWGCPVVVDTHPGAGTLAWAAMRAADVIAVPVPLRRAELAALEAMLVDFADFPLVIVPSILPPVPPGRQLDQLAALAEAHRIPVAPPVSEHRWLQRRAMRRAVTLVDSPGRAAARAAAQFAGVADFCVDYVRRARQEVA